MSGVRPAERDSDLDSCDLGRKRHNDRLKPKVKKHRAMQIPIVQAAPLVKTHAEAFRDLFENRRQFEHFQNYGSRDKAMGN